MVSQISYALQVRLNEKKVAAQVDYLRVPDDGPIEAFTFRVTGPHITIRNIEFSGADAAEVPLLAAAARRLQGSEYALPTSRVLADKNFLPAYRERSYLKAAIVQGDAGAEVFDAVTAAEDDGVSSHWLLASCAAALSHVRWRASSD